MPSKRTCACEGHTLDRLLQPAVLAILADGALHGYALVERLKESPTMRGSKPNDTGVYRLLNVLEQQGLVTHQLEDSELGPARRVFALTESGRVCLGKWVGTLDKYQAAIADLVVTMRAANVDAAIGDC